MYSIATSTRRLFFSLALLLFALPALAQETVGLASYYADRFHGKPTSTGEKYNRKALTAASQDYPYGTLLEVTEVASGKKVKVRVNDCGPHHPDRIIDLSRAAAQRVGLVRKGTSRVRLRVVKLGDQGPTCKRSAWTAAASRAGEATFGVQVGTFGKEANAERTAARLKALGYGEVRVTRAGRLYRVFTGKVDSRGAAEQLRARVRKAGFRDAAVRHVE